MKPTQRIILNGYPLLAVPAIEDANTALNEIAKTRGRNGVLRLVELETKTSPLNEMRATP